MSYLGNEDFTYSVFETSSLKIQCYNKQSGEDDEGESELTSDLAPIVQRASTAFCSWLLGLSGTQTMSVSDEEEEGEPRIFWNFGYKNICKKKCCYKCCEVNKIICLLQGGPTELYTVNLSIIHAV